MDNKILLIIVADFPLDINSKANIKNLVGDIRIWRADIFLKSVDMIKNNKEWAIFSRYNLLYLTTIANLEDEKYIEIILSGR